jgi:hypothetical protein
LGNRTLLLIAFEGEVKKIIVAFSGRGQKLFGPAQPVATANKRLDRTRINRILNGKLEVHGPIAKVLGLREVSIAE